MSTAFMQGKRQEPELTWDDRAGDLLGECGGW